MEQIPFVAHEADMARIERLNRRLWILCIILVAVAVLSNAGWIYYESQFQTDQVTVTQDVDATAEDDSDLNINTVGGDLYGSEGESTSDDNN